MSFCDTEGYKILKWKHNETSDTSGGQVISRKLTLNHVKWSILMLIYKQKLD